MKRFAFLLTTFLAATTLVHAQSGGMKDMPIKGMDMEMDKEDAKGTVHKATA
jgi:hypothetical protein